MLAHAPWTEAAVAARLVLAFRAMPGQGFYSPRKNQFEVIGALAADAFDFVAFSAEVLGRESRERDALLTWARARALGERGRSSIAVTCQVRGISRASLYRWKGEGLAALTAAINDGLGPASMSQAA